MKITYYYMKSNVRFLLLGAAFVLTTSAFAPAQSHFTAVEQQQVSVATKGLFARSNSFSIDFCKVSLQEYSFPLPVGKAVQVGNSCLDIKTVSGDAVKAMFDGTVRLSRKTNSDGNVVVLRHKNGLETVYANNVQNLVKVGQTVKAGQTIAIVGEKNGRASCEFSIMVNGGRINPSTIIDVKSHRLRKQIVLCTKNGGHVNVAVSNEKSEDDADDVIKNTDVIKDNTKRTYASVKHSSALTSLAPEDEITFEGSSLQLNLSDIEKIHWAYPLPGSHVISPYGGSRNHAGVDLKTKPNDEIVAAFDGVVTLSGVHFGYGNCIVIKHAYGFETLYGHQSRNFVTVGQHVKAGEVIGLTGRTGRATTEHLHFEVHYRGVRLNPAVIFDHNNKSLQQSTLTLNKNGRIKSEKNYFAQSK